MKSRTEYLRDLITNCKMDLIGMPKSNRSAMYESLGWTILTDENFKLIIKLLNKEVENEQV